MNQHIQTLLKFIEQSEKLSTDEKKSFSIAARNVENELDSKNRDLEFEASLEKVRDVALSMRKAEELTGICEVLFSELRSLGFSEMRNTMINIHNDDKGSFLNYDFSDEIGKSITHFFYNTHPVIENQVKQIRSSKDAFSVTAFSGSELEEWKKFRKSRGEQDDPRLENISELFYYFYSIGTGSIGISSFRSLTKEKLEILKKFRNVFDLAYQRYMDVSQAEAQAREAQIELSLERVRARTMAMQKSDELQDVAILLFQQMNVLGVPTGSCGFNIWNKDEIAATVWTTSSEGALQAPFIMPHTESEIYKNVYSAMKKGETFLVKEVSGNALKKHFDYLLSLPGIGNVIKKLRENGYTFPEIIVYHFAFFNNGYLSFHLSDPFPEVHDIFKRFAKVFEQTFTRFLDLQKAEAQAREAKIEASLERVRSRSLAMNSSDELVDASTVLFNELKSLNIETIRTGVGIVDETKGTVEVWSSQLINQQQNNILGTVPFNIHPFFKKYFESWKRKESYFSYEMVGDDLKD